MNEVMIYVGEYCSVRRNGDSIVCVPRDNYKGLKLSDARLKIIFNIYANLLMQQKLDDEKEAQDNDN